MAKIRDTGRGRLAGVSPGMHPSSVPTRHRPTQLYRILPGNGGSPPGHVTPRQTTAQARQQIAHIQQYPPEARARSLGAAGFSGRVTTFRTENDRMRIGRTTSGVSVGGGNVPPFHGGRRIQ